MTLYTLRYFENHGALIAFVQEARGLEEHPAIVETYLPPFTGKDSYTGQVGFDSGVGGCGSVW